MMDAKTVRAEVEYNRNWIRDNPDLFSESIERFLLEHSRWIVSVKNDRPGFMTVIAVRQI